MASFLFELNMLSLYPHQKLALQEIENRQGHALLALECGLGKTIVSLAYVKNIVSNYDKILIICPLSVVDNWYKESQKFFPPNKILVVKSYTISLPKLKEAQVFIMGHEFLNFLYSESNPLFEGQGVLIIDESHKIKNPETKLFNTLMKIRNQMKIKACLLLSATPILHRPGEIWPQIKLLNPSFPYTYQKFVDMFAKYKNEFNHYGLKNKKAFVKILKKYCVFMGLEEAGIKLPNIEIKPVWLGHGYNDRFTCSYKKIDKTVKLIKEMVESGEKVLVFVWYRDIAKMMQERLKSLNIPSLVYMGGLTLGQREKIIKQFKDEYPVLIGNVVALGLGTNLQFCKRAIVHELVWSPEEINQAIKRIHRIGSRDNVKVYIPVFESGFDKKLLDNFIEKAKMLKSLKGNNGIDWESVFGRSAFNLAGLLKNMFKLLTRRNYNA